MFFSKRKPPDNALPDGLEREYEKRKQFSYMMISPFSDICKADFTYY